MSEATITTHWYRYHQNNSGGVFDHDPKTGIGYSVWIEATDAAHADFRAMELGLYFDGVENGEDCDCCGDRWTPMTAWYLDVDDDDGYYRQSTAPTEPDKWAEGWGIKSYVHPINGDFYAI